MVWDRNCSGHSRKQGVGTRDSFMGVQVMWQGRSVSRKQHRIFLVGGTSKARSGDVLRFAAEYQEKVEMVR